MNGIPDRPRHGDRISARVRAAATALVIATVSCGTGLGPPAVSPAAAPAGTAATVQESPAPTHDSSRGNAGSDASSDDVAPPEAGPGPVETMSPHLTWAACGQGLECAIATVPLDHDDPSGGSIEIDVARMPTLAADGGAGALFVNPGGPGGSAVRLLRSIGSRFADDFTVYAVEPRGVAGSVPATCDRSAERRFRATDSHPDSPAEQAELEDAARAVADACAATSAQILPHMTTIDAALDLDLVRRAIDEERISWLGFSYGTAIGLAYADRFPSHVRAMALDGLVDPRLTLVEMLAGQALGIRAALDAGFARCRSDGRCPSDPWIALDALRSQVERQPIGTDSGAVGPAEVALAAAAATYSDRTVDVLAEELTGEASADLASLVRRLADGYVNGASFGTYLGVECTDGPVPPDAASFRRVAEETEQLVPGFGAAVINELLPCAFWPVPDGPEPEAVHAIGAPTILVVGTTGDPATPFSSAEAVADDLVDAVLVTHRGEGHTATLTSRCVDGIVRAYLVDLALPDPNTVCTD